jgi:hypothetical protein
MFCCTDGSALHSNRARPGRRSSFQLHVVGSNSIDWALASGAFDQAEGGEDQHVVFHGWVSDEELELLYSHTRVAVAPLLSGAGVKGKVRAWRAGGLEGWRPSWLCGAAAQRRSGPWRRGGTAGARPGGRLPGCC